MDSSRLQLLPSIATVSVASRRNRAHASLRFASLLFPLLFMLPSARVDAQEPGSFEAFFIHAFETLSAMETRFEGSIAESDTLDYIEAVLAEQRIEYRRLGFDEYEGAHSFASSIYSFIPGSRDDELLMVIPINDRAPASSGAARIALGIGSAAALRSLSLPIGVRILFLGAEYGEDPSYPLGSRQFLDDYLPAGPSVVLYLDLDYAPERITLRAGDEDGVSPFWLVESTSNAMGAASLSYLVRGNETQFYRLGLSLNPSPLGVYLDRSYAGLSLHSEGSALPNDAVAEWASRFYEFLIEFVNANESGFEQEWDRHYLLFQAGSVSATLREGSYLALVVAILLAMVLYPLVNPKRFKSYMESILRNYWALPALLILTFFLLLVGTLIVDAVASIKRTPDLWMTRPGMFFALKISTAIFIFALLSRFVRRIPFPTRGRYYIAVALILLYVDIIVLSVINISLAYYVVWACIWCFLFSLSGSRIVKAVCLLISPIWFVRAAYDIFTLPEPVISDLLINSRLWGNLIVAVLMLPFMCMFIRLEFMFRNPRRRTKRLFLTVTDSLLGLLFGTVFFFLLFSDQFDSTRPQPVEISEEMIFPWGESEQDSSAVVRVSSPAPLTELVLEAGEETTRFDAPVREWERPITPDPSILTVKRSATRFLGRIRMRLDIDSVAPADDLTVEVDSDEDLLIYDANFPYSHDSFGSAQIHIGRHPRFPITVEFTVPESQRGQIAISGRYLAPESDLSLAGEHVEVTHLRKIIHLFDFDA